VENCGKVVETSVGRRYRKKKKKLKLEKIFLRGVHRNFKG
jgi:hypothetical protein